MGQDCKTGSQSYQSLVFFVFQLLLISFSVCTITNLCICNETAEPNSNKRKNKCLQEKNYWKDPLLDSTEWQCVIRYDKKVQTLVLKKICSTDHNKIVLFCGKKRYQFFVFFRLKFSLMDLIMIE